MKIGINLLFLVSNISGGIEIYVRNLIKYLAKIDSENEYYLFCNRENWSSFSIEKDNFHCCKIGINATPSIRRIIWEQTMMPLIIERMKINIFHSPSYTFPILSGVPGVLTICDMLYETYPEKIGKMKLFFWRQFVPWSAKRCRKIITISENSKNDIIKFIPTSFGKVVVTPLALDESMELTEKPGKEMVENKCLKYGIKKPFILNVGGLGKHKNSKSMIYAMEYLGKKNLSNNLSLVIAGNDYGAKREILSLVNFLGLAEKVILPGYVDRADLAAIYAGAEAYLFASYFEGFGLTLLEAMNCGIPIVASNRSSIPEVCGDAAVIVDPDNPGQIADALFEVITNSELRTRLISRGYNRVREFSWEKTARLTLRTYEEAVL